uniref:DinB-like domain-containing protein n=1 Tax=Solibacter usitatus (strain Ellin6076) TaxID=234267 RepID=Q027H9_SOLUE
MPDLLISKPDQSEHAPYYGRYIDMVPDGDILGTLAAQIGVTLTELRKISEQDSLHRYAQGKWSVREIVGHLIDAERIFSYRALRFARNDQTKLPGFEQDDYIAAANFDERPWSDLIDEFYAVRRSSIAMFRGLSEEAWTRTGIANDTPMSVRAAAYVIAGHERHHLGIIREKYTVEKKSEARPN